ncbi:cysteine-rich RLK (RECEPTOR-like protein kinase) 8 [Abeliophyllum distichum]|uniref:Cysteine-rich RLK (RECEPTOR-like protein kinase) 8 n=1 Tax=Abeliophyllum distichum TaxID=126358 RepID=A0ABD1PMV9_9LAMI
MEGIDYFDMYAPVARITSIRILFALASIHDLHIHQMDVKTIFLNGDLDEEVYMEQPEGFVLPRNEQKGPISKRKGFGGLEEVLQTILKYGYGFREQFGPIPNGYGIFRFPYLLWKSGLVDSDAIDGGGTAATASTVKNKKIWSKDECTSMFLSEEMRKLKRKL